jgi:PPM family protein phosphatase
VGLMGIGEFARGSLLSPKALRLYDELGLLRPASVDPDTGYRWYAEGQLNSASLIATLRQLGVPLAQIKVLMTVPPDEAAPGHGLLVASGGRAGHSPGASRPPR